MHQIIAMDMRTDSESCLEAVKQAERLVTHDSLLLQGVVVLSAEFVMRGEAACQITFGSGMLRLVACLFSTRLATTKL
jgi:hypothetical protein